MAVTKTRGKWHLPVSWGFLFASVVVLLYFEHALFNEYFETTGDYLLVAGILLAVLAGVIPIVRHFPRRVLLGLITGAWLASGLIWGMIAFNLPLDPTKSVCRGFWCEQGGQILLLVLHCVVIPVGLVEWSRREETRSVPVFAGTANITGVLLMFLVGSLGILGYCWVALGTAFLALIDSLITAIAARESPDQRIEPQPAPSTTGETDSEWTSFQLTHLVLDLGIILLVGVFGFASVENRSFGFNMMPAIALGLLLGSIVGQYAGFKRGFDHLVTASRKGILVVFGITLGVLVWVRALNLEGKYPVGLPPVIVGVGMAYLWNRILLVACDVRPPHARFQVLVRWVPRWIGDTIGIALAIVVLVVVGVFRTSPNGGDSDWLYFIGLLLTLVFLAGDIAGDVIKNRGAVLTQIDPHSTIPEPSAQTGPEGD